MKKKAKKNLSLLTDVWLLIFIAFLAITAILMTVSGHVLANAVFLGIALVLLLLTYFGGIVVGLIGNFIFVFGQIIWMIYLNEQPHASLPVVLSFWLVMPLILSVSLYFFTEDVQAIQDQNGKLKTALIEHGAFDSETNLRTNAAFVQDTRVAIENNHRFDLPVTLMVFRIRYYEEIRRMLSSEQIESLLRELSEMIDDVTRVNDLVYYLEDTIPTWGVILYTDEAGAKIVSERVKAQLAQGLELSNKSKDVNIALTSGIASWNDESMKEPYDLTKAVLKEMEYDV